MFKYGGDQEYPNLIGAYTYDGGHLTEMGRRKVATDLINQLAAITRSMSTASN
jgi:hypothetical protein